MKLSDIHGIVYVKKSSITHSDPDLPHYIIEISRHDAKSCRVVLDNGLDISPAELTDTPCLQMTCRTCKYHNKKVSARSAKDGVSWKST